jgi:hypothetical protein
MKQPLLPSANWITGQFHEAVLSLTITFGLAFSGASQATEPFEVRRAEAAFVRRPVRICATEVIAFALQQAPLQFGRISFGFP